MPTLVLKLLRRFKLAENKKRPSSEENDLFYIFLYSKVSYSSLSLNNNNHVNNNDTDWHIDSLADSSRYAVYIR